MPVTRLAKSALVATIALIVSLATFGNITDYQTNLAFVQHVLMMDTVFPDARIGYRAITNPLLHHAAYIIIIAAELLTAALCWIGAIRMLRAIGGNPEAFTHAKRWSIAGLLSRSAENGSACGCRKAGTASIRRSVSRWRPRWC